MTPDALTGLTFLVIITLGVAAGLYNVVTDNPQNLDAICYEYTGACGR